LGGNSKTSMIVTFSPSSNAWDETVSSFDVGTLARNVINFPLVDVNKKQANFLKELEDKICHLKGELWAATFREGLYVSAQTYEKMTQDVKVNNEKILDLIREIRELEEHMLSRESQYRSLNESFEKTNRYLESSKKALKEKEEVVKKDKDRVDHLVERQEELVNSANILMDVCKNTTKEVEIYHKKYQDKCNTNINNAKLSEDMLSLCARCMKEIKNTAEHYTQSQSTQVSKVQEANQTLQNDHVNNLDRMKQFSLDIQDKFKSYNLNSDELFKSDVNNFDGKNIEKFVSDTYENSISHLP
jgi:kinesin family protein 11